MVRCREIRDENEARRRLVSMRVHPSAIDIMAPKAVFRSVYVDRISVRAANILKQEMLARDGEVALPRGASLLAGEETDALLLGTLEQYRRLIDKLRRQPFGLKALAGELEALLFPSPRPPELVWRGQRLPLGERTLIMGILNVTPDSFSDGGRYREVEAALAHARSLREAGADIIDIGGESTRPGHATVTAGEEIRRVLPVVEGLVAEGLIVSIDTMKADVAEAALAAGAHAINDVWGLTFDPRMAETIARHGAGAVLMHNQDSTEYRDMPGEVRQFLQNAWQRAVEAGIPPAGILLDPGFGFGKDAEQNLQLLRDLEELCGLPAPLLIGTSRKRFIGHVLDLPVGERDEGTAATVMLGILKGAAVVRVHNVAHIARTVRMTDALVRER